MNTLQNEIDLDDYIRLSQERALLQGFLFGLLTHTGVSDSVKDSCKDTLVITGLDVKQLEGMKK